MNQVKSVQNEEQPHNFKMHNALSAIAKEMQRFYAATNEDKEFFDTMMECKSCLRFKKQQVQKLKGNLKIACDVAKIVISAKEKTTGLLKSHLVLAKGESAEFIEKQIKNIQIINSLSIENKTLRDNIENFRNFIELGYKELQKVNQERLEELPVIMQLKKLIICCSQYYENYHKEHKRRMRLEQSNRFLYNKVNILENSIEAISEELRNLRNHNLRLLTENNFMKDKYVNMKSLKKKNLICCEYNQNTLPCDIRSSTDVDKDPLETTINGIDVTSHLCTVKQLLSDQDLLLEDLKVISQELCTT